MLTSLALLTLTAAAQDVPVPDAAAPEVAPAAELLIGPVLFSSKRVIEAPELVLDACVRPPGQAKPLPAASLDGRVTLQLSFRKGKAALVTVTEADDGLGWLTPCLQRELAAVEWPVRKGTADVPIRVSSAPAGETVP